jgi:GGDEF domain-containing protein
VAPTDLLIRYGGEEFSVIIAGYSVNAETAKEIGENIRQGIQNRIIPAGSPKEISSTIYALLEINAGKEDSDKILEELLLFLEIEGENPENYTKRIKHFKKKIKETLSNSPRYDNLQKNVKNLEKYLLNLQRMTASIGGAVRTSKMSLDDVIFLADKALYSAKKTRNTVVIADTEVLNT